MKILQVALLAVPIALIAGSAIAQPVCYMIDANGRMIDLSRMCGKTPQSVVPQSSPTIPAAKIEKKEPDVVREGNRDYQKVGETDSGDVYLDLSSIRRGSPAYFELMVFQPDYLNGVRFRFRYSCPSNTTLVNSWDVLRGNQRNAMSYSVTKNPVNRSVLGSALNAVCADEGTL